jgi:thiamine biosynthesis lipoprotein
MKWKNRGILFFLPILLMGCENTAQTLSFTEFALGTVINVKVYDSSDSRIQQDIIAMLKDLEQKTSIYSEGTELAQVRSDAGLRNTSLSQDTWELIRKSLIIAEQTDGLFDPSIGPLVKLWGIGTEEAALPEAQAIEKSLSLVNYRDIELLEDNQVYLKAQGMIVDLGAIAKGFSVDLALDILKKYGSQSAILDFGGNVFVHGVKPDGSDWNVGIQDPQSVRGTPIASLQLNNKAIVTSGKYERFFISGGRRYHHILSPRDGYPVENGVSSVSIIADESVFADGYSTAVFLLGPETGQKFIEENDDLEAVILYEDQSLWVSSGLKSVFRLLADEYTLR